jgi:hypothetical protein
MAPTPNQLPTPHRSPRLSTSTLRFHDAPAMAFPNPLRPCPHPTPRAPNCGPPRTPEVRHRSCGCPGRSETTMAGSPETPHRRAWSARGSCPPTPTAPPGMAACPTLTSERARRRRRQASTAAATTRQRSSSACASDKGMHLLLEDGRAI